MAQTPLKLFGVVILFVFLIAACDRLYILANTYLDSKILMCIGARLEGLFYLAIIVFAIPVNWVGLKLVSKIFLGWRCMGVLWLCFIQLTGNHVLKEALWANGFKGSGALAKSIFLATIQETFILSIPLVIVYLLWEKAAILTTDKDSYVNSD